MKTLFTKLFLALALCAPTVATAQQVVDVDRSKYPDYTETVNPDWSLMPQKQAVGTASRDRTVSGRPDHVNNAETRYFPPVFNQAGGSCGSASRICYMFSHELAAYRDVDGSKPENYYPSHFVWLHTNSPGQGKNEFVMHVGVPSAATYGGQTYSSLFGYQEETNEDFGWMQGYDKWFEAMHNRMLAPRNFPVSVATEEGREAVKNWLWNHNGDDDFHAGGICGIGVASACEQGDIPETPTNASIGVAGMSYVKHWGEQVDHALTIVGYDDRIEFDLDGDGIYGEPEADELGAWIIVNSWGLWANQGFIYCPYAKAMPTKNSILSNNAWMPEIYHVRKDYRPLRTIKLKMEYSRRSEIALSAGVSTDLNAEIPEKTVPFIHFTYAGDGKNGNANPAPEVPMLGRWADGKLHTEPMEFGYDLTDLSAGFDKSQPLKYFFIVETKSWAQGKGLIHNASIMDYEYDLEGIETPFGVGKGVEIKSAGNKTIISVIVYGNSYYAPQNAAFDGTTLTWQAPQRSALEVASYNIYRNGLLVANLSADTYTYTPKAVPQSGEYGVSAVYIDEGESDKATAKIPVTLSSPNVGVNFSQAGFTIPGVFDTKYTQATIEYWIKPNSLYNWNQSGGPGWGSFMFHANGDGTFTAGWDTGNRVFSGGRLTVGKWTHVAIVVDKNKMSIYLNGESKGSVTSQTYSGLGGFGDLVFSANGITNAQDAVYDEIRIWNTARTTAEVKANMNTEFTGSIMPQGLIAYLKGDLTTNSNGESALFDCVGGHHATINGTSYIAVAADMPTLSTSDQAPTVSINAPTGTVYAGIPVTITATYNGAVNRLEWTAEDAGIHALAVASPIMTFATAGTHTITLKATNVAGDEATATYDITVEPSPEVDATFTMTASKVPAGERITFLPKAPLAGYLYEWSMPGADTESAASVNVATYYHSKGTYNVTLTVTAPDGTKKSHTEQVEVMEVAPEPAFSISPAVVVKGEEINLTDESRYAPTQWKWLISNDNANYIAYDRYKTLAIDKPGVYNLTLTVANETGNNSITRERALIVCNADSKNGLSFSNDNATITTSYVPLTNGQNAFTIEWWMNADWPADNTNGIGESNETMLIKTMSGGKMQISIAGKSATTSADYVIPGEWHHYAVTYGGSKINFYRDGEVKTTRPLSTGTVVPTMKNFRIGGSVAPFQGNMDEFRIWGSTLTNEQIKAYANGPIEDVAQAESANKLLVYYHFNQTGGDVQDATSKANHGVRTNFGPDGDAWALSKGVFCLAPEGAQSEDVTGNHLKNFVKAFNYDGNQCVNPNLSTRAFALKDWKLENAAVNGNIITGAHVDKEKNTCLTVTTGWDNFATKLNNHKVYQTVELAAGFYSLEVEYDSRFEGQCGGSYVVAALGKTLPVTEELSQSLGYTAMKEKGTASVNKVDFVLTEKSTVSLGLVVNMTDKKCMAIQRFTLKRSEVVIFEKSSDIVQSMSKLSNERLYYVTIPNHQGGLTTWAVAQEGNVLTTNQALGIPAKKESTTQQFAFVSNDEGATRYLYHAATKKFINKDGSLAEKPTNAIYFKEGAYDTTFVAYFDDTHYLNIAANQQMVISDHATPDDGNSCAIYLAGTFNAKEALSRFPIVEVTEITLNHAEATLEEGEALTLTATINPSYATDKTVTWTTSNAEVAVVVKGVVSALAPGTATITAKAGDKEATCVVTVEKKYVPVTSVMLNKTSATLVEGDTLKLTATINPFNAYESNVTWETSDASIATVQDGMVIAVASGTVTITAKAENKEATCLITVEKKYVPVAEVILSQTELVLEVGETHTLTVTILPENATDQDVVWSTSSRKVASVRKGVVTAAGAGTATISARVGDITVTCTVTVNVPDGIEQVTNDDAAVIYDLTGRRVEKASKGIYIVNGKKVVLK